MRTIRERFKGDIPPLEFPYVEVHAENEIGLVPGRYVSVDAIAVAADELSSDDLRLLWETVSTWSGVADEAQRFLAEIE